MGSSFTITIQNGKSCESKQGETVLSALIRAGVPVSAPCGGRGICEKCLLKLVEGKACLLQEKIEIKQGSILCACKASALSDITVSLPDDKTHEDNLLAVMSDKKILRAGAAFDIGTTTVKAQLVCLETGETLDSVSVLNNQRSFGADVMSRITAAQNGKTNELFAAINRQVEEILCQFIEKWKLRAIEKCTVSGNTAMLHLFAGVDPSSLGHAPYTPVFLEERLFKGKELSLSAENINLLPGISTFVGADITAGLAFTDIMKKNENSLFVDIGTNGEIALWKNSERRLYCCSTAAGPCFEGAEISCGMGALSGAINRASLKKEKLFCTTIENKKARGICGAGLIDVIAAMRELNAIDETGALAGCYAQTGFPVAEGITVTQRDIRQFQLAKSAIYSGIKIICKTAGLQLEEIDTLYIAGGLGYYINLENAAKTGLLPGEFIYKTAVCGNTSLKGAVKSLAAPAFLSSCKEIVAQTVMVELAMDSEFADCFADNMGF